MIWTQFVMSKMFVASQVGEQLEETGRGGGVCPASSIFYILLLMQTAKEQIHVKQILAAEGEIQHAKRWRGFNHKE